MTDRMLCISAPDQDGVRSVWLWCPACDDSHRITVGGASGWGWDGNETAPTFTPSILVTGVQWSPGDGFYKPSRVNAPNRGDRTACHSFLTDGVWNYLGDCTHDKAGQSVPMVPLPDWLWPDRE